jgi:hypothetical protein
MQKPNLFKVGKKVEWKWLGGRVEGSVVEVHTEKIVRILKGKRITRNGSVENPAYVVKSEAGNLALKLGSELAKR